MKRSVTLKTGRLDITVKNSLLPLNDLCGFGSRSNPKRGYLFVSKVLGKHYPVRPSVIRQIYRMLGERLSCIAMEGPVVAIGMAETATGFGQGVFEHMMSAVGDLPGLYIHTTRYALSYPRALAFEESHSHATEHILYEPCAETDRKLFNTAKTLILLDDEISTGNTLANLATAFRARNPHLQQVALVCITNWMDAALQCDLMRRIPADVHFVSILEGSFSFAPDKAFLPEASAYTSVGDGVPKDACIPCNFGRLGCRNTLPMDWMNRIERMVDALSLLPADRVLVIGTGEFTYIPFKLAEIVENRGVEVYFQSTTRSPILIDGDIHCKIEFKDNYDDIIDNFLYNVLPEEYSRIIVCYETCGLPAGHKLIDALGAKPVFFPTTDE